MLFNSWEQQQTYLQAIFIYTDYREGNMAFEGTGTLGTVLQGQGAGATPKYSTATYPSTATGTGTILRADGTNWVATTATYPNTAGTSGNVLTSDGTNWNSTAPAGGGLSTVSGQLTNAQIKALHGTPVQILAAPGAGKVIVPVILSVTMNYGGSNVFTAGASQTVTIYYGTQVACATGLSNSQLVASSSQYLQGQGQVAGLASATAYSGIANAAINFYNSSATEITGNAANNNTISYYLSYYTITIP
jgi:hypothetical protein